MRNHKRLADQKELRKTFAGIRQINKILQLPFISDMGERGRDIPFEALVVVSREAVVFQISFYYKNVCLSYGIFRIQNR